jgi:hypothetical protein
MAIKGAPIMVPCEGSGADGHPWGSSFVCPMCGELFASPIPEHDRDDVIARLLRGDFDDSAG